MSTSTEIAPRTSGCGRCGPAAPERPGTAASRRQVVHFVRAYRPHALAAERVTSVPATVLLAQAALASGWGTRAPGFNFFGIRALGTEPDEIRQLLEARRVLLRPDASFPDVVSVSRRPDGRYSYVVRDWFRRFGSPADAFIAHGAILLRSPRYRAALGGGDAYSLARTIAAGTPAATASYRQALTEAMRAIDEVPAGHDRREAVIDLGGRPHHEEAPAQPPGGPQCPSFVGDPTLDAVARGKIRLAARGTRPYPAPVVSEGPAVAKVQGVLRDVFGYAVETNGQFGPMTGRAVADFKAKRRISPADPVVGPQTMAALNRECPRQTTAIDDWLGIPLTGWASPLTTSSVRVHTSGTSAFDSLAAALARCTNSEARVVISGWDFYDNTLLRPGLSVGAAITGAATRGATVRALLAHTPVIDILGHRLRGPGPDNTYQVAWFNKLPNGRAIHDKLVLHHVLPGRLLPAMGPVQLGMHHQKAWVVYDGARLVAWIGGIDINPNRTTEGGRPVDSVLHDVQAELEGPAAVGVYELLRARWNTHPDSPPGSQLPALQPSSQGSGTQRARIVTTFGDPTRFAGLGPSGTAGRRLPPYPFAPSGSKSYRELVFHCLAKARTFVYLEDQYLVDEEVGRRLAAAMPNLKALIIVIAHTDAVNGELHQAWERRRRVLGHLAPFADKVAVLTGKRFIHAKTWIFDDTVAVVGSANVNRRGFQHDSEAGVAFGDLAGYAEVRALRGRLWSELLGPAAPPVSAPAEHSLALWKRPPASAGVVPYNPNAGKDGAPVDPRVSWLFSKEEFWDIVDPGCP